jgi:hypothetical protein
MSAAALLAHGCNGKERFGTHAMAETVRRRMKRNRGRPMKVYACRVCNGYHVGAGKPKGATGT